MVHEEIGAVLLGRDRVGLGDRHHLEAPKTHLDPARGAGVGAQHALDDHRRLLGEPGAFLPRGGRQVLDAGHALHHAAAVADHQELDLPARAPMNHPAAQLDGLAHVGRRIRDADPGGDP